MQWIEKEEKNVQLIVHFIYIYKEKIESGKNCRQITVIKQERPKNSQDSGSRKAEPEP